MPLHNGGRVESFWRSADLLEPSLSTHMLSLNYEGTNTATTDLIRVWELGLMSL